MLCVCVSQIRIVSVGGNDVALQPLLCTVLSMFAMVYVPLPTCFIKKCACACPPNLGDTLDFGCMCCGVPNCLSSLLCGFPFGFPCESLRTLRPVTSRSLSWHCVVDIWWTCFVIAWATTHAGKCQTVTSSLFYPGSVHPHLSDISDGCVLPGTGWCRRLRRRKSSSA